MSAALGPDVHPQSSAFRIFRRDLVDAGDGVNDPFVSVDVLLSWATTRVRVVDVEFAERTTGSSAYGFGKLVRHAVNMITGYSTRPLRWVSLMGVACATFGFALLAYVITRWVLGGADVAGFTFLAAAITLFSGVQLLSLGVLGEYLGRMHFRSMGRPPYIVRRRTDTSDEPGTSRGDPV
jgi:undecaprenyl-phosphate 4-deoxy-4-formamido-L-arabinose transferase